MNRSIPKIFTGILQLLCISCLVSSCSKYDPQPDIKGAAYLRVFNEIPFTLDLTTKTSVVPFFTMIIDPVFNENGIPSGGKTVGDYLGTRLVFNPSTSTNEGNPLGTPQDTSIKYNINYEYPGNAHVLTAPSINGLDLSAWAQISSGKHRVLFIARPKNNIDFSQLSDTIRNKVIIDTTIDLKQGEVYTLETVLQDIDATRYGAYLRQESFIHEAFDRNKNYVSFYNLSGNKSSLASNPNSPSSTYFYDTMNVAYTYYLPPLSGTGSYPDAPIPEYTNMFLTTLQSRMAASAPYFPLPVLPMSNFYDNQGTMRTYYNYTTNIGGSMPYFLFNFIASGNNNPSAGLGQGFSLYCDTDPVMVNTLSDYQAANHRPGPITTANLNMLVQSDGRTVIYPAVYVMELVFNKVYLMQVLQKI